MKEIDSRTPEQIRTKRAMEAINMLLKFGFRKGEIAKKSSIARTVIYNIEQGVNAPGMRTVLALEESVREYDADIHTLLLIKAGVTEEQDRQVKEAFG